jgi:cell division protein ZapA (FtsZ GTPase activity inhibitor)
VTEKRQVTIELGGQKYRMNADADEGHLEKLASIVDERITALGVRAARTASPAQLLAIVALGLADELMAAEKRCRSVEDITRKAITSAIDRIDRRLEADSRMSAQEHDQA